MRVSPVADAGVKLSGASAGESLNPAIGAMRLRSAEQLEAEADRIEADRVGYDRARLQRE
jgi:hypothetical protein